jgi:hypothetical protein
MPALSHFDYIFAIDTIFAFLDAWNIGEYSLQLTHETSYPLIYQCITI